MTHNPGNAPRDRPRHLFQGPARYRILLLIAGITLAVCLLLGGAVYNTSSNWVWQLCSLIGALSATLFTCLVAVDLYRPQVITPARMKVIVRFFLTLPAIAITLAVIGFFI